jgi:CubicO group peptidase (beta-lactamase class C family)/L-ascorbate metabolism protein UlaG (beta-lactamase superfamily)
VKNLVLLPILLIINLIFQPCFGQEKIDVTYIANAGFLIESGGKKILIDALFNNGWDTYLIPADSVVSKIINQQGPFKNVNLMLITHNHEDHFNDSMVVAYLNNNPENILIAPPLVTNAVLKNPDYKNSGNQLVELDKINQEKNDTTIDGIRVRSFFIQHDSRPQIEHVGYLIDINDCKIFHSGDYNGIETVEFRKLQLQQEQIDLALLNFYGFWSTKEDRMFTEKYIRPERIILMHIPPSEIETIQDSVKLINDFTDITVFEKSLDVLSQSAEYKINELMSAYADNGQFNGTILVKKGENIIYENAFGFANREWNIPNTPDSKFLIGSVGKSITAFMILLLVNDGLIDLNATINEYIPGYSGPGENKATIHQMLTHTSGIPNHGAIPNLSKKLVRWSYDTDQYLALIKDLELEFEPGTGFAYSGIAYNLLAIICEKVTNKEFADLLNERIFFPLAMNDTKLDKNLDIDMKRADGYEYHLLEGYMHPSYIEMCHVKGSGGVLTTVEDLARFNNECFNKQQLLSKDLYQKMFTRYIKDWQYYGYGWWIADKILNTDTLTIISHGGSTDGYKAYSSRIVEDSIDILLFQNNYYRTELGVKFDYAITNEIIDLLYGEDYSLPKKSIAKEMGLIIGQEGIKAAVAKFDSLKALNNYYTNDSELNQLGKELYSNYGMITEPIEIYKLAINEYPNSFQLFYSYGELLSEDKNEKALDCYRKCINLYQNNSENQEYSQEYENALKKIEEVK